VKGKTVPIVSSFADQNAGKVQFAGPSNNGKELKL
jgi:hypothetical protein